MPNMSHWHMVTESEQTFISVPVQMDLITMKFQFLLLYPKRSLSGYCSRKNLIVSSQLVRGPFLACQRNIFFLIITLSGATAEQMGNSLPEVFEKIKKLIWTICVFLPLIYNCK
jgi:hypothetical protein